SATQWYFDNLLAQHVPFDIIGLSYYPWWHGSFTNLQTCLSNAVIRYAQPVMVMETAFPWANSTNLYGIPASTNGQVQFVVELAKVIKRLPASKGLGVFWWGTEYQQLSGYSFGGWDRRSFFDATGEVLPVADAFGAMSAPVVIVSSVSN